MGKNVNFHWRIKEGIWMCRDIRFSWLGKFSIRNLSILQFYKSKLDCHQTSSWKV